MNTIRNNQTTDTFERTNIFTRFTPAFVVKPDPELKELLADLDAETPWGVRQAAAQKIGAMRNAEALPVLLDALLTDPFWMVRCAIIQALEMIGDARAIPTLREVAKNDGFQVVRSYAAKAIERLSQ